MHPQLIENIHDLTEGVPRAVVRTLRDLVDEKRGIRNRSGTLERLFRWSEKTYVEESPKMKSIDEQEEEQDPEVAGAIPSIYEYGLPQFTSVPDATIEIEPVAVDQMPNQEIDEPKMEMNHLEVEEEPPVDEPVIEDNGQNQIKTTCLPKIMSDFSGWNRAPSPPQSRMPKQKIDPAVLSRD